MIHLSEEELILHYYGEEDGDALATEQHLESCIECRAYYGSLQRILNVVDALPVPPRGPEYEGELWARIAPHIPARRAFWWRGWAGQPWSGSWRWAAASAACAGLMTLAFLAGRAWPVRTPSVPPKMMASAADPLARERVLMVAVGDYLERSQMVLVEISNASPSQALDISSEQVRVEDLISESRLYRQTAEHTGDVAVASILDELDRVLLEIAHAPSRLSAGEADDLRRHLETDGILFKVRVLGSKVRHQEERGAGGQPATPQKL
jgi:hypothetical protein